MNEIRNKKQIPSNIEVQLWDIRLEYISKLEDILDKALEENNELDILRIACEIANTEKNLDCLKSTIAATINKMYIPY